MLEHKMYITFGQAHLHSIGSLVFDKDCVALVHGHDVADCYRQVHHYFGKTYCFSHHDEMPKGAMEYFPNGIVEVPYFEGEIDEDNIKEPITKQGKNRDFVGYNHELPNVSTFDSQDMDKAMQSEEMQTIIYGDNDGTAFFTSDIDDDIDEDEIDISKI